MNALKRIWQYEFWPFWLFYFPAYFYYIRLALKAKSPLYFTMLNKCMYNAGAFSSSKSSYLKAFPPQWVPKTLLVESTIAKEKLKENIKIKNLEFPMIVKPDLGERGKGVEKIDTFKQLWSYLKNVHFKNILLQEYITYPIELGILFYRNANGKSVISSIGEKEFCTVTGDGKSKFKSLVKKNIRISSRASELKHKFQHLWEQVIPKGQKILVEPIGNHNRGTAFLDGRSRFSKGMLSFVETWANALPGFDYGRFDIRIKNWNAFQKQEGVKILEVNGVNSEPIHIYDPKYSLIQAYKDIFHHMRVICDIAIAKRKENEKPLSFPEFCKRTYLYATKKDHLQSQWKLSHT